MKKQRKTGNQQKRKRTALSAALKRLFRTNKKDGMNPKNGRTADNGKEAALPTEETKPEETAAKQTAKPEEEPGKKQAADARGIDGSGSTTENGGKRTEKADPAAAEAKATVTAGKEAAKEIPDGTSVPAASVGKNEKTVPAEEIPVMQDGARERKKTAAAPYDPDNEPETDEERKRKEEERQKAQLPPQIRRLEMEKRIIMERISGTFNSADDVLFVNEIERIISGEDCGPVRELLMNMSTDSLVKLQDSYDPMMDLGGMLKRAASAPRREAVLTDAHGEKEREEVCVSAEADEEAADAHGEEPEDGELPEEEKTDEEQPEQEKEPEKKPEPEKKQEAPQIRL